MRQSLSRGPLSGPFPLAAFLALVRHPSSCFRWLLDSELLSHSGECDSRILHGP